jgi:2-polyprenyl-6-hydroxyphenyl methylase/3-demethylubiquinone-9 3-methyltransferase
VIAEISRVLTPGGVFLYDTINRTLLSKLVVIKIVQEWSATRFVPANLHDWAMFIKPAELRAIMADRGLQSVETVGLRPALRPLRTLQAARLFHKGEIDFGELGRRLAFRPTRLLGCSYMGYARKPLTAG